MKLNKIINHEDYKEVIKKSSLAFFIRLIGFISGYLFIYYIIKHFGTETQGRLSICFSFMMIGSLISRLGMDINFVKIFAIKNNFNNAKGIYFKVIPYSLILSVLIAIVVFLFSNFISVKIFKDPDLGIFLKWTAPCIVLFTFVLINAAVFRGLKKNSLYSFLFNGGRFLFALLFFFVFLFLTGEEPTNTVIAHTTSISVLFVISVYFIFKFIFPWHKDTNYEVSNFIKDSLPMLFSAAMTVLLGWTDTIILGVFEDSDIVGMYAVILKIAVVISFTLQAINSILAPKLSYAYHNGEATLFKKLIRYSTIGNLISSLFVLIIILYFRNEILRIFGEEFLEISTALIILCFGQMFNAICGPVGTILQMTGRQRIFRNILILAVILNITLNLSLVKSYGINGVAIATATSLAFWNLLALSYARKIAV